MRITYDPSADALSIVFVEGTVTTKEIAEGIAAEYGEDGRLSGLEILDVAERFGTADVLSQLIVERVGELRKAA